MGKYDPWRDHLRKQHGANVTMTFDELDGLVALPMSAQVHAPWWANEDVSMTRHMQCKSWQAAGYDAEVDLAGRAVSFTRKR